MQAKSLIEFIGALTPYTKDALYPQVETVQKVKKEFGNKHVFYPAAIEEMI